MEESRLTLMLLIWVTSSQSASSKSQYIPEIINLDCFNDFITNMFCTWETDSSRNCSKDFSVKGTRYIIDTEDIECDNLVNERHNGSILPNTCICHIRRAYFTAGEMFFIKVTSHGKVVGNTTIYTFSTVKPLAPSNVQVESHDEQVIVKWNSRYDGNFIRDFLDFQVQVLSKLDRTVVKNDSLAQREAQHFFNKKQLNQGDYIIRVRTKPSGNPSGTWSEWSPEYEWTNDYSPSILDLKTIIIPTVCLLMLFLIIVSYICINRCRTKWWNNIPDPAKSSLVHSNLLLEKGIHADRKNGPKKSCGNYLSRLVKAHRTKCQKLAQEPNTRDYINVNGCSNYKKVYFEPENEVVENAFQMYTMKENEKNPNQEDMVECERDNHLLGEDSSFAKLLSDILDDDLINLNMDLFKSFNTENLFGPSAFKDTSNKKEAHGSSSKTLDCRESGYHSYDSDDSPLDIRSDGSENGFMPSVTMTEGYSCENKETLLLDINSNKFANAEINCISDTTSLCLDDFRNGINHPKGIFYYNTKCLFSLISEGNLLKNTGIKMGNVSTQTLKINGEPTYKSCAWQVSGYKSFDQSVNENDLTIGCQMSGYKSFDQENGPGLGCHISGYKSFDQAVQEKGSEGECHTSGYKSFDQAIQDNNPVLGCHISGYKSFDQAIQDSGPAPGCHISGYKIFDQAIQDNSPAPGCHISGYKSFDQAIQDNGSAPGCHISGYKSFDQAVQENVSEGTCHTSGNKSFDQSVQKTCPALECHISGYKGFEQASQDYSPANFVSGYKCFDQAVQENGVAHESHMPAYTCFDQAVQENGLAQGCLLSRYQKCNQSVQQGGGTTAGLMNDYQSFDNAVQRGYVTSTGQVTGYQTFDQAVQQSGTPGSSDLPVLDSGYKPFESLVAQKKGCIHENERLIVEGHCQNITDPSKPGLFTCDSNSKQRVDHFGLHSKHICNAMQGKTVPKDFPGKPCHFLKAALGSNITSEMTLKHDGMSLALTFDICEHLRNLENSHGKKISLNGLQPCIFPITQPIFSFLAGDFSLISKQFTLNKHQSNAPMIDSFENMSYFAPLSQLQNVNLSHPSTYLLIQQVIMDKDSNSYMKIA